jgi:GntR family transcriptional regulator, transcriptional repressor for pyruvate dehydrogenase complex
LDLYQSVDNGHISQRTVVAQVMTRLKELIASGRYQPGDRLPTEHELAKIFGVGRSSIREAIKVFQHLGVVDSRAAKGTFLRDRANISSEAITWAMLLGNDDLLDVLELREAIESVCFDRLSEIAVTSPAEAAPWLEQLEAQVAVMNEAARSGAIQDLVEADYRFHGHIVEAGGNKLFRALYANLHAFMSEEIRTSYTAMEDLIDVARDHHEILITLREATTSEQSRKRHREHFARTRGLLRLH